MTTRNTHAASLILSRPLILVLTLQSIALFINHHHYNNHHHVVAGAFTIKSTPQFPPFTRATTAAALSPYSPTATTTPTSCAGPTYRTRSQLLSRPNNKNHIDICDDNDNDNDDTRRTFITTSILSILSTTIPPTPANAALPTAYDSVEDLTSRIYNEDGSPIDTIDEAKSRTVSVAFPTATTLQTAITSVDGIQVEPPPSNNTTTTATTTTTIEASYQVPEKWTPAPDYLDTLLSVQKKACDRIVIYQVPDRFEDSKTLDKATTIGITKALAIRSIVETGVFPENLKGADLIGGKKVPKAEGGSSGGKRNYYEFDLAVAPERCSKDGAENLGLGFCPYDTIVLFSATIIEGKMMVCGITCTRDEWKRSSADIKRVRESFFVGLTAGVAVPAAADETSAGV